MKFGVQNTMLKEKSTGDVRNFTVCIAILLFSSLFSNQSASAFKPNEAGHLGITSEAMSKIAAVSTSGARFTFSRQAQSEIRNSNLSTDISTDFFDAEKHFDNEGFVASSTRLLNFKRYIISEITGSSANGSQLNGSLPSSNSGRNARIALGSALHTVQDFYAHTNWVELGNTSIDTRLGRTIIEDPSPYLWASFLYDSGILLPGLNQLTSGYFELTSCAAPLGKVRHGNSALLCPAGLNKDEPSRPGYPQARYLAVIATRDFINQILESPGVYKNSRAIKMLMGR
jgi:hypothetical protein